MQLNTVLTDSAHKRGKNLLKALLIALLVGMIAVVMGVLRWANRPLPALTLPRQDIPSNNAYNEWVKVLQRITPLPRLSPVRRPFEARPEELRPAVEADRRDLETLRRVIRKPIARPQPDPFQLAWADDAGFLLAAQSRLSLSEGRPEAAMAAALDAAAHAALVGREVECLFGCARLETAWLAARGCVPSLDARQSREAGKRVDALSETFPTWADEVAQMRVDSLIRAREAVGTPKRFARLLDLGNSDSGVGALRAQLVWTFYPKANGYQELADWWDRVHAEGRKPFHQRGRTFFTRSIVGRKVEPGLITDVGPTLALARLRLLRLELALQEYRATHHRYPPTLETLKPAVLAELPRDPFNDQPFHYSATRRRYTLYSVGPNLFDEEGAPFKETSLFRQSAGDLVVTSP